MTEALEDRGGDNLQTWLAGTPETAIDPDQPIVDPHHHLWDRRPRPELEPGQRTQLRYLGDELVEDIRGGGHNVVDTVFVECLAMYRADRDDPLRPVGETEFVQGVAAMAASGLYDRTPGEGVRCCGGIVGYADLTHDVDRVERVLRAHMDAGANFRGVRHAHGWHPSSDMPDSHHPTRGRAHLLAADDFRAGFGVLGKLGLTFDCWGYHTQLDEVADLAAAFPNVTIILNHCGGPMAIGPYEGLRETDVFRDWSAGIRLVARYPNVVVKVGGCGMPTYGFGFESRPDGPPGSSELAAAWQPYFALLIELFGADRCMFESNFPVDKVSCSYTGLWNAFKIVANELQLSPTERADVFYGTAARAYSLTLPPALAAASGDRYAHVLALIDCFQEARYTDILAHFAPGALTVQHFGPNAGRAFEVTEKTVDFMTRHNPPCRYSDRRQTFAGHRFVEQHRVTWPGVPDRASESIETVIVCDLDRQGRVVRLEEYGDPATLPADA